MLLTMFQEQLSNYFTVFGPQLGLFVVESLNFERECREKSLRNVFLPHSETLSGIFFVYTRHLYPVMAS